MCALIELNIRKHNVQVECATHLVNVRSMLIAFERKMARFLCFCLYARLRVQLGPRAQSRMVKILLPYSLLAAASGSDKST